MESLDEYCRKLEVNNEVKRGRNDLFMKLLIYLRERGRNGKND